MCKIKSPSTLTRLARHMILPQNHMEIPMLTSAPLWTLPRIQARKRNRATRCLMWVNTVKCLQPVQPPLAARAVQPLQAPNSTLLTNCSACARSNFRVPSPGLRAIGPKNRAYGLPPPPRGTLWTPTRPGAWRAIVSSSSSRTGAGYGVFMGIQFPPPTRPATQGQQQPHPAKQPSYYPISPVFMYLMTCTLPKR